jgi:hypothetical protein
LDAGERQGTSAPHVHDNPTRGIRSHERFLTKQRRHASRSSPGAIIATMEIAMKTRTSIALAAAILLAGAGRRTRSASQRPRYRFGFPFHDF